MLYPFFPRQIAIPFRITVDKDNFYKEINKYNCKKRVFASIYNYTGNYEIDKQFLVVDKVFFDFDTDPYENTKLFIKSLLKLDYKFTVVFSGAGYHVYVFTNREHLKNPKHALYQFQNKLLNGLQVDRTSLGDVARVATIPNTYNTKRKRYAIPISLEDFELGHDYIVEMAKEQRFLFNYYGSVLADLTSQDADYTIDYEEFEEPKFETNVVDLPPCLNYILSLDRKGYRARFLLINYLKHAFYLLPQIEDLIRKYFTREEANHCIVEERQPKYLYWKDIIFPCCESVKMEGFCPIKDWCDYTRPYDNKHVVKIYK